MHEMHEPLQAPSLQLMDLDRAIEDNIPKGEWLHAVAEDNTLSFRSNETFQSEWLREFATFT